MKFAFVKVGCRNETQKFGRYKECQKIPNETSIKIAIELH